MIPLQCFLSLMYIEFFEQAGAKWLCDGLTLPFKSSVDLSLFVDIVSVLSVSRLANKLFFPLAEVSKDITLVASLKGQGAFLVNSGSWK